MSALTIDEIQVWLAWPERIRDPALIEYYASLLDNEEYPRWQRIKIPRVQHEYLIAHALLRESLSRFAPLPPSEWQFSRNQYGRPEVVNPGFQHLRFNLSHTKGLVACALAWKHDIGIDVETLDRNNRLIDIAGRFFSEEECADLQKLPRQQQPDRFFDYWTLKESFIKAKGMGLALPLGQFSFHFDTGHTIGLRLEKSLQDNPSRWAFWLYQIGPKHRLALCHEHISPTRMHLRQTLANRETQTVQAELLGMSRHAQTLA